MAERFGVNRHTVRQAVGYLADEGLVHSRRGAGVFVLTKPIDYRLSKRVRFRQNLLAAGRLPERRVLSVEVCAASDEDARTLKLELGEPVAIARAISFADGTPVALAESRFPEVRLPGLSVALAEEGSVTDALARVGVPDYRRASTRLAAALASATQALHLRLREGAPLLLSDSLNCDANGVPVEHGRTWFASERITLTLDHVQD